jgi:hypothetical protein
VALTVASKQPALLRIVEHVCASSSVGGNAHNGAERDGTERNGAERNSAERNNGAERNSAERNKGAERNSAERNKGAERNSAERNKGAERNSAEHNSAERDGAERDGAERDDAERARAHRHLFRMPTCGSPSNAHAFAAPFSAYELAQHLPGQWQVRISCTVLLPPLCRSACGGPGGGVSTVEGRCLMAHLGGSGPCSQWPLLMHGIAWTAMREPQLSQLRDSLLTSALRSQRCGCSCGGCACGSCMWAGYMRRRSHTSSLCRRLPCSLLPCGWEPAGLETSVRRTIHLLAQQTIRAFFVSACLHLVHGSGSEWVVSPVSDDAAHGHGLAQKLRSLLQSTGFVVHSACGHRPAVN